MKSPQKIGLGILGVAALMAGSGVRAQNDTDKYEALRAALAAKEREVIGEAQEARTLAAEYQRFLKDPETETEEKPDLRKVLIAQEALHRKRHQQAVQIHAAIEDLGALPHDEDLTLAALQVAYRGLGELADLGGAAWEDLIAERDEAIDDLKAQFAEDLARATETLKGLDTVARANQLLLSAIDSNRSDSSDADFRVSLRLPRVKSAVELGFGLSRKQKDENSLAQTTLLALIGYSQFFWDHSSGARERLGEGSLPSDSERNIFGVADGWVLTSDAIAENQSTTYYLSEQAKESFNSRIRAIWGTEGRIAVSWWNQESAPGFHRACQSLSTVSERGLLPNRRVFELLAEIDELIEEQESATEAIGLFKARFREELADAMKFGDKARLSSAHYNARIWDKDSRKTLARFEAAHAVLEKELAACANEGWKPDTKGISTSAAHLERIQKRFHSVRDVKDELTDLLQ